MAELSRTARFSVLGPANGGSRRRRERFVKTLMALLALVFVLGFDYPIAMPSGGEFDRSENGVWIEARWSNTLVPSQERREMVREMARHGIKWIYADEGVLRADGSLPAANSMFAGGLAEDVRIARPLTPTLATRALAWIQGRNRRGRGNLSLADPSVRGRIVAACKFFVEQQGFDGVHLDIEPAPSGDPDYLKLLDEIRAGIGSKTLSVAAMKWTPLAPGLGELSFLPYNWGRSYYREVAARADQMVLVAYGTAIPFANLYIKYVGWQTGEVLDAVRDFPSCRVLVGLPTYNDVGPAGAVSGRPLYPNAPNVENLGTGLQGVIESLRDLRQSGNLPPNFAGVALFASWTTSPEEWDLFDRVWK